MRRIGILLLAALGGLLLVASGPRGQNFGAHLSGDEEVPPVAVDTQAQGQATFHLNTAENALDFRLIASNIENVTQAHIHCGAVGVAGPVVVFLFGFVSPGVDSNGVLSQGTRTDDDVIDRPDSEECPDGISNFAELIAKMRSGDAYVNVHTEANPPGEIRGQIRPGGPKG